MGGKEIPAVDLSLADVVADEFLLDAACIHELLRLVDHGHDSSSGLLTCKVACFCQDDHAGENGLRLFRFVDPANLVRPEDKWTSIENVSLR